ncbi:MAG: hypothetical protein HY718_13950, partial [Planctomycetes bacterium]|nr:hypothetical protein [Planctomycetota bacterium]
MVTIGCSLGLMVVVWNVGRPTANPLAFIAHASAVLCVAWGILAHVLCRRKPRLAASPYGHDLIAVLQVTQLVLGLAASVVMFYVATTAVLTRIPSLPFFAYEARLRVEVWPTGLLDVALVAVA